MKMKKREKIGNYNMNIDDIFNHHNVRFIIYDLARKIMNIIIRHCR